MVPERSAIPLVASLHYTAADPYAVRMEFHIGDEESVEWIFARELLTVGIVRRVGDGDVQVTPSRSGTSRALSVDLSSPYGSAQLEASPTEVADFLDRTYEIVPAGREPEFIDIDLELDFLFWNP